MHRVALSTTATAAMCLSLSLAAPASADETSRLSESARVVQETRPEISRDTWDRARCIAVIPSLKKAAFIVGGEYGKGVMSCKAGEVWSAPVFMQLAKGSWGFQAGAEQIDVVLLVMNESGADKLLANKTTLGADASVAAGPIGRAGTAATDAAMTAEILSYSKSKGLFAGIDLSGGVLRPDEEANKSVYGASASPRTILATREISAPTNAAPFLRALGPTAGGSAAPATTTAARTSTPEPRASQRPTTDDDVRAQLVDAQQLLDRLLADTTPGAVGTSGTVGTTADDRARGGTVTIDRARLLQLRQQIDAAIAALNKR